HCTSPRQTSASDVGTFAASGQEQSAQQYPASTSNASSRPHVTCSVGSVSSSTTVRRGAKSTSGGSQLPSTRTSTDALPGEEPSQRSVRNSSNAPESTICAGCQ